ncbi:Chromosome partition protein Smc [Carpediemonas membranifera]|uniref:Cilia- and flagella-associated protein 157 n=1 Tax=Carpediemonas membranifera TaxID=201153 RepID=A0A8J6E343_9EUKA|nr:Chromosome partition protein Smc [Carpediemonas membranifera]|eukprot:KAG9395126.1 Chromosome partition protein Smc [Carpediemonas membranifera]
MAKAKKKEKSGSPAPKEPKTQASAEELQRKILQLEAALNDSTQLAKDQASLISSLNVKLAHQKDDYENMLEYLRGEVAKRDEQIGAARREVTRLTKDASSTKDECNKAWEKKYDDLMAKYHAASQRLEMATGELGALQEFQALQVQYEEEIETLKGVIDKHGEEMEELRINADRATFRTKEGLRRDMERALAQTRKQMIEMTETHLEAATEDTIKENARMGTELAYQARASTQILESNQKLTSELNDTKRQLDVFRQNEVQMGRKLAMQKALMRKLTARIEAMGEPQPTQDTDELKAARMQAESDAKTIELLQASVGELRAVAAEKGNEAEQLRTSLAMYEQRMSDSVEFLFDSLGACSQLHQAPSDGGALEADLNLLKFFLAELRKYPPAARLIPHIQLSSSAPTQTKGVQTVRVKDPLAVLGKNKPGPYGSRLAR